MIKYTVFGYLATDNSFISLHYDFLLDATTVREIVGHTCDAIWEYLKPVYMSARDKNAWIRTDDEYYERRNFLNCIGAVDGKHIRMRKQNEIWYQFFNYKNFFSTVLMAVADSDYCFISVEVRTCVIVALYHITTVGVLSLLAAIRAASVHKESLFWLG
jgi:hypothetical protein